MNITEIKVRKLFTEGRIRAVVSIIIDHDFAVHDLKVIEGIERLFVAMPNRRSEDGRFQDIVHPITSEAREQLESAVLEHYRAVLEEHQRSSAEAQSTDTDGGNSPEG